MATEINKQLSHSLLRAVCGGAADDVAVYLCIQTKEPEKNFTRGTVPMYRQCYLSSIGYHTVEIPTEKWRETPYSQMPFSRFMKNMRLFSLWMRVSSCEKQNRFSCGCCLFFLIFCLYKTKMARHIFHPEIHRFDVVCCFPRPTKKKAANTFHTISFQSKCTFPHKHTRSYIRKVEQAFPSTDRYMYN